LFIILTPFTLPRRAYPPLHDMDIYSYHEGEVWVLKGQSPFNLPLINTLYIMRLFSKGIKRGEAPLRNPIPLPFIRGEG